MGKVKTRIIDPTIMGLKAEGIEYKGFIFFGLINVKGEPYVIEYNARLGDPEAEAIIPRIKSDLFDLIEGVAFNDLGKRELIIDDRFTATVVLTSGGYPGHYEKGYEISGLDTADNCIVFHAGTKISENKVITSGGRVLAVTAFGRTLKNAMEKSYRNVPLISFRDMYYRKDIGFDL
jgi:phosphoribosylamine--glycine ligase